MWGSESNQAKCDFQSRCTFLNQSSYGWHCALKKSTREKASSSYKRDIHPSYLCWNLPANGFHALSLLSFFRVLWPPLQAHPAWLRDGVLSLINCLNSDGNKKRHHKRWMSEADLYVGVTDITNASSNPAGIHSTGHILFLSVCRIFRISIPAESSLNLSSFLVEQDKQHIGTE